MISDARAPVGGKMYDHETKDLHAQGHSTVSAWPPA